jgi:hypothetical protein
VPGTLETVTLGSSPTQNMIATCTAMVGVDAVVSGVTTACSLSTFNGAAELVASAGTVTGPLTDGVGWSGQYGPNGTVTAYATIQRAFLIPAGGATQIVQLRFEDLSIPQVSEAGVMGCNFPVTGGTINVVHGTHTGVTCVLTPQ